MIGMAADGLVGGHVVTPIAFATTTVAANSRAAGVSKGTFCFHGERARSYLHGGSRQ